MVTKKQVKECEDAAKRIRHKIIDLSFQTGRIGTHIGGSLSAVELLVGLYIGVLHYQKDNLIWEGRDRVILSKGHAALALYPTLAEAGIIDAAELATFKKDGSRLGGHPSLNGLPGIEFASGSLGQGLSLGVGVSIALKRKNNKESRVFVVLGDGECDEGSVWEAASSASHFNLDNLVAVVDVNNLQYDGYTKDILNMEPFEKKWESFGWKTMVIDGHNMHDILNAYSLRSERPFAILAQTVKGKGVSFMENNWRFHNASLTVEQYEQAIEELRGSDD